MSEPEDNMSSGTPQPIDPGYSPSSSTGTVYETCDEEAMAGVDTLI